MKKLIYSVGLNDKDTHRQEVDTDEAAEIIAQTFLEGGFPGLTIKGPALGFWKGESEKSLEVILYAEAEDIPAAQRVKAKLQHILNQEAIALEISSPEAVEF